MGDKPHVFGIGLPRTGTSSLTVALEILGWRAKHYPLHLWELCQFEAATDISVASRFEFLDQTFPGSRFVYTVRDMESWLASCQRHWAAIPATSTDPAADQCGREYQYLLFGRTEGWGFDREVWRTAYQRHDERVRKYFAERPQDLLIFNLTKGDGWKPLMEFLDVTEIGFPHWNRSQ